MGWENQRSVLQERVLKDEEASLDAERSKSSPNTGN